MAAPPGMRFGPGTFVILLLTSLAVSLLIVLAIFILGEYTKTRGRLLLTPLLLAGFCVFALAPSMLKRGDRYRSVAAAGLLAVLLGFVLVVTGVWATPNSDAYWKAAGIASVLALSLSHVCWLLLLGQARLSVRLTLWSGVAAACLVALLAALGIILEVKAPPYWWAVSVAVIVLLAGSVMAPALSWRRPLDPGSS